MLSDRSYMRGDYARSGPSVLAWLLGLLVGMFVLQNLATTWFRSGVVLEFGALSGPGLHEGYVWTVFTYALLHGGVFHLLCNGLGLFFFGRELQTVLGQTRFFQLLLISALGGAIAWMGIHFTRSDSVLGASGIVMGLLAVYACLYPRRPFTLMLFFVIPVTVQPIWLVTILGGIDLIGFLFSELPGRGSLYGVAHSCHLGGLAAGWIFYQTVLARSMGWTPGAAAAIEPPSWLSRRPKQASPKFTVNLGGASAAPERPTGLRSSRATSRDVLRAEVDRILDKINVQGFGSLTADEKRVLDEARNHLHPR